jgi:hypothetical protein
MPEDAPEGTLSSYSHPRISLTGATTVRTGSQYHARVGNLWAWGEGMWSSSESDCRAGGMR